MGLAQHALLRFRADAHQKAASAADGAEHGTVSHEGQPAHHLLLDDIAPSRGGTPTGERVPPDARRAPSSVLPPQAGRMKVAGAEVGDTRLPAFRLPFFRSPDGTNGSGPKWSAR
jgi:hypothetical protein